MYEFLYALTTFGIIGWLLMIFFPFLPMTKWFVEKAVFPVFLALCYVVGVGYYVAAHGLSFVADFASYEGVVQLLRQPQVALIVWIHVLAFDQLVGRMIFLENEQKKVLPLPLQSVVLIFCFLFGPLGWLLFMAAQWWPKTTRRRPRKRKHNAPSA